MSDDQAEVGAEREDRSCADLREIVAARIRSFRRIDLAVEERNRVIADNELGRRLLSADDLPSSLHPHRVVCFKHVTHHE